MRETNLDSLNPHWHRAGDLQFHFGEDYNERADKYLHSLYMPRLMRLALHYTNVGREVDMFYTTWNMPNLKNLSLFDLVQFPLHSVSPTKLEIHLSRSDNWWFLDIFNLLVSSGSLEDLSINCTSIQWDESDNER